jgi:O-antigen/teichoic acid export membrane protein
VTYERRALHGALWNALESVGSQLTSFVLFLVFARLISPSSIGVVQIVVTLLGFLTIFVEHGFTTRIIRNPTSSPQSLSTAFWMSVAGAIVLAVMLTLGRDEIARFYRAPEIAPILAVLAWTIPLITLSCVQTALLVRDLAFRTQALRRLIAVVGGGIVGIGLAWFGWGVWSLVARLAVESLLDCVIAWLWTSWRPTLQFARDEAKAYWQFGSRIVGSYSIGYLSRRADELIVGYVLGSAALGYYAVATRAMSLVTEIALRAGQRTAIPVFSHLQDDPVRLREAYYGAVELVAAVAVPIFMGLSAIAPELCITLYGSDWGPVIPPMQILGFAGVALAITIYTAPMLVALGKPNWFLGYTLVETVVNFLAVAFVVRYGIVAVAVAYAVRSYLVLPLSIAMSNRLLGTTTFQLLRRLAAPTLASLVMFAAVSGLRRVVPLPPTLSLLVLVGTGAMTYVAVMWIVGRQTVLRLHALARQLRPA